MKNLPDRQLEEINTRLRNYTELPDDDLWEKIAITIPVKVNIGWVRPAVMVFLFALYSSVVWLAGRYSPTDRANTARLESTPGSQEANRLIQKDRDSKMNQNRRSKASNDIATGSFAVRRSAVREESEEPATSYEVQESIPVETLVTQDNLSLISGKDHEASVGDSLSASLPQLVDSTSEKPSSIDVPVIIEKPKKSREKPTIYFQVAPSLSYYKIIPAHNDNTFVTKLNPKNIFSDDRMGINADLGLQWRVSNRLNLYTGLSYHQENGTISFSYQSGDADADGNGLSYVLTPRTTTGSLRYTMKNAGVSAGILYLLQETRLRHRLGAGLQYQIGFASRSTESSYENSGSTYLNYQIIYRVEFPLNPKYTFFLQPAFTHSLMVQEKLVAPFEIKHYNASMGFGMVYRF